jgi:hypothetical protein
MSAGYVRLYVTSRGGQAALLGMPVIAVLGHVVGTNADLSVDGSALVVALLVLVPLLTTVLAGATLESPSEELDHTAALPWGPVRAAHGLLCLLVTAAVSAGAGAQWPSSSGLARNAIGFMGVTLVCAAFLRGRLAVLVLCVYVAAVYPSAGESPSGVSRLWAWFLFSGGSGAANAVAAALALAGVVLWSTSGSRRRREQQPA